MRGVRFENLDFFPTDDIPTRNHVSPPAVLMRRLAGGAGRRVGSDIRPQTLRGPRPGKESGLGWWSAGRRSPFAEGARVPGQASQTCSVRRAERALARPVRGLANPWRLPALHRPRFGGKGKGESGVPAPRKTKNRAGGALAFFVALLDRRGNRVFALLVGLMRDMYYGSQPIEATT